MALEGPTPAPVLQFVTGLWSAGVLKGALELKVFDYLSASPRDVDSLNQALGAHSSSLRILLDALVALGLLETTPKGYGLTDVSAAFLVSSKPAYLGGLLLDTTISSTVFDLFKDYRRVVTEGYHVNPWEYGEGSNDRIVSLTRALFTLGSPTAHALADHMGWTVGHPTALRLLDVGCGSAVYGLVPLQRLPNARLTAQDWPLILPVAQACAAEV
jgi:C-methyltransferase